MKQWWHDLQQREQQLILIGTLLLAMVLLWAFAWLPYQQNKENTQSRINARGKQLIEITQIAARAQNVKQTGQPAASATSRGARSLLRITDESARAAGLAAALKRIEPDSEKQVQVWLENADFDKLISWLELIDNKYAITVHSTSINKVSKNTVGAVNAHITLRDP